MSAAGIVLLYRSTCRKCRVLSLAVVVMSFGQLRRIPLSTPEANRVCAAHEIRPGKLVLVGPGRAFTGWRVLPGYIALLALRLRFRGVILG